MTIREYVVPPTTDVIFVADLFSEDYVGGAELTTDAIISHAPAGCRIFKMHSTSLTPEIVAKNRKKHWVLCNWSGAPREGLAALVTENCAYTCVEYDYKYCIYRSSHLHGMSGTECDCHTKANFAVAFYQRAKSLFFMSEGQRDEYYRLFPIMKRWAHIWVLSSVWKDEDILTLRSLAETPKVDKWAVLAGGSWIKNMQATEQYCKSKNIDYDLVGGLAYQDFLKELSRYKGLVFHPAGFDTCPRLVVEAKLMGLELDLNDNVQHKNESWFLNASMAGTVKYLMDGKQRFWGRIKLAS